MGIARLWWVYFKTIISYRHLDLGWVSFLPFFLSSVLCVNRDRILNDAEVTKNGGAYCNLRKTDLPSPESITLKRYLYFSLSHIYSPPHPPFSSFLLSFFPSSLPLSFLPPFCLSSLLPSPHCIRELNLFYFWKVFKVRSILMYLW